MDLQASATQGFFQCDRRLMTLGEYQGVHSLADDGAAAGHMVEVRGVLVGPVQAGIGNDLDAQPVAPRTPLAEQPLRMAKDIAAFEEQDRASPPPLDFDVSQS